MTQAIASAQALAVRYQQHLHTSIPFTRAKHQAGTVDIFLIPPEPTAPARDSHAAMRALVDQGVLSDYRYIDSNPQTAILAIRA